MGWPAPRNVAVARKSGMGMWQATQAVQGAQCSCVQFAWLIEGTECCRGALVALMASYSNIDNFECNRKKNVNSV